MRQLDAIFCDDIRHEIGGKISLIGIYGPKLFVREFPAVLPKLCVMTKSSTLYTEPFKQLKIRVFKGAEVLAEADIKMDGSLPPLEPFMSESDGPDAPIAMMGANAFFILSPFEIEGHAHCALEPTQVKASYEVADYELSWPQSRLLRAHVDLTIRPKPLNSVTHAPAPHSTSPARPRSAWPPPPWSWSG